MVIALTRLASPTAVTLGSLDVDGAWQAWTCEPPNDVGHPAIPEGRYRVIIDMSVRFGRRLPLVTGVPGRLGIRIHPGNSALDTSGCILLGTVKTADGVLHSREACEAFQKKLADALAAGDEAWITIQDTERNV